MARARDGRRVVLLLVGLLASGCAAVDPGPFVEFSSAIEELRAGADVALATRAERTRERFLEEALEDLGPPPDATTEEESAAIDDRRMEVLAGLHLGSVEGSPFAWTLVNEPLYFTSRKFRAAIHSLNTALLGYGDLLVDLSAPERISPERFERLARELNGSLNAALARLEVKSGDRVALFSAAAATTARAFFERLRRNELKRNLESNQEPIALVTGRLQEAMRLSALELRQGYDRTWNETTLAIARATTAASRKKRLEALVEADERFIAELRALEVLSEAYGALPSAHRELLEAVAGGSGGLAAIRRIFDAGRQLHDSARALDRGAGGEGS